MCPHSGVCFSVSSQMPMYVHVLMCVKYSPLLHVFGKENEAPCSSGKSRDAECRVKCHREPILVSWRQEWGGTREEPCQTLLPFRRRSLLFMLALSLFVVRKIMYSVSRLVL